ncbi:TetR/AcrR family transcriptional regulator [Peribacillus sp. SCS-155]|uniref:TetR/AcrR family transcriptional regulator n=1 Tax=Peribacillus sedimenti TaxID=3115297 RepID=UPI003906C46B
MKEKITEHSIRLFEKKGFTETSIQDIVESIGVTKGTFYYYFSSKEELLMDIHNRYIDQLLSEQEKILLDETKSSQEKLSDIVLMLIQSIRGQGPSAKVFFREMQNLSQDRLEEIVQKRDEFRLNIQRVLEEGTENGEFKPELNAPIATFGILGMANWSYQWFNPEGLMNEKEVSQIFTDMILSGIKK